MKEGFAMLLEGGTALLEKWSSGVRVGRVALRF